MYLGYVTRGYIDVCICCPSSRLLVEAGQLVERRIFLAFAGVWADYDVALRTSISTFVGGHFGYRLFLDLILVRKGRVIVNRPVAGRDWYENPLNSHRA